MIETPQEQINRIEEDTNARVQKVENTTDKTQTVVQDIAKPPVTLVKKGEQVTVAPTTTEQEDITLASQRKVNLIWERTQSFIAICVVVCAMGVSVVQAVRGVGDDMPTILVGAFFAVIGFYFGRTNHSSVGGIGAKSSPEGSYSGR